MIDGDLLPIFATKDDGVEYYGELLCTVAIGLPFTIGRKSQNPVEWFIFGVF